jgi:hypothetical protein
VKARRVRLFLGFLWQRTEQTKDMDCERTNVKDGNEGSCGHGERKPPVPRISFWILVHATSAVRQPIEGNLSVRASLMVPQEVTAAITIGVSIFL